MAIKCEHYTYHNGLPTNGIEIYERGGQCFMLVAGLDVVRCLFSHSLENGWKSCGNVRFRITRELAVELAELDYRPFIEWVEEFVENCERVGKNSVLPHTNGVECIAVRIN